MDITETQIKEIDKILNDIDKKVFSSIPYKEDLVEITDDLNKVISQLDTKKYFKRFG